MTESTRKYPLVAVCVLGLGGCAALTEYFGMERAAGSDMAGNVAPHGGARMHAAPVEDGVIAAQRAALATAAAGFGPQSPRDIGIERGTNPLEFEPAPNYRRMNLCNIHFHESAEHRGGEFTTFAGNGDGKGHGTGFVHDGKLTANELAPVDYAVGRDAHGTLEPGDTIEIHYVYSTARIEPGPTLGACLDEALVNPQLRVEAQVFVLVNDRAAADLIELTELGIVDGFHQAVNLPDKTGSPIVYAGSTTGPSYNEKGSPFQVTWSVRPRVMKVDIRSVAAWLGNNVFDEDHAHGVRNLVINPTLLAPMAN